MIGTKIVQTTRCHRQSNASQLRTTILVHGQLPAPGRNFGQVSQGGGGSRRLVVDLRRQQGALDRVGGSTVLAAPPPTSKPCTRASLALPCPPCRASVHKAQKCTLCFSDSQLAESQQTGATIQRIGAFQSPVTLQLYLGIDPVQLLSLLLLPGPEQEKVVGWLCAALRSRVTKIHCSSPRWEHSRELAGAR